MSEHTAESDAHNCERAERLEGMCDRLAVQHVALQDAVTWALAEALTWRNKMPRTRENNTYPNGRQDGVDMVVATVRAAMSAHLRGEDPTSVTLPGSTEEQS